MRDQVLLVGNGINDVTNNYKWKDLIDDLIKHLGLTALRPDTAKPFPLFYEEIYLTHLRSKRAGRMKEKEIKEYIGERVTKLLPNLVHKKIRSVGFSEILTTNYDYAIENEFGISGDSLENEGVVKEISYSVFRHTRVSSTNIWHIHGEINFPTSILLGYEQYSGQLQHIRNYVISGTGEQYKNFTAPSLFSQIKKGKVENNSWLDLFFTKDLHIIGLTLKFIETDLWWLITYRARCKLEGRLPIKNRIFYYYPGKYKDLSKLEMLEAHDITAKQIGMDHDLNYYDTVLSSI